MKAKLLFAILPALGLLAGCSGESKPKEFLEEEEACLELFGNKTQESEIKVKRNTRDEEDYLEPKIGIQYKSYEEDRDEDGNNETYYAVRYIAALASTNVDAVWKRGISQTDSNQIKGLAARPKVTQYYRYLTDVDGSDILPSSFGSGYKCFVAYTMYDIPAGQASSYMVAYLTITDPEDSTYSVASKAVITQVAKGGESFSVASNKNGYFMYGKINGEEDSLVDLDAGSGTDHGKKENVALLANDSFGFFQLTPSLFQFYGYNTFDKETYYVERISDPDYYKVRVKGTYSFYVNQYNQVTINCSSADVTLYLKPNSNWLETNVFSVYYTDNSAFNKLTLIDSTNKVYALEHYDFKAHPVIIFVRHETDTVTPSWDNDWDQTNDIRYDGSQAGKETGNDDPRKTMYTVKDGTWSRGGGSWSVYSA